MAVLRVNGDRLSRSNQHWRDCDTVLARTAGTVADRSDHACRVPR